MTDDLTSPAYNAEQLGQVASLLHSTSHPQQIGPYRILEAIGQGGMGVVYKAEQRTPIQRIVALKVIKLGMDTVEFIGRFESERQALAMMNHPNVARVYDAGATETGRPYLVMEFVSGEPITTYCDRHHLDTRQRLELFIQACEAIQHAHQKAIIHRDLKPSNILVTLVDSKPQVKVIDFGVAKAISHRLTERTMFTETGRLVGTPEFMSPEQAEGSPAVDIDTRTDIYSLGVVLYELLSGALPVDPKTLRSAAYAEIQRIIRDVDPPRPSTRLSSLGNEAASEIAKRRRTQVEALARELRSELEWIPLKAMRKERKERYQTSIELADDIRAYLANRPLRAGPESAGYRFRKFLRRNKRGVAASAAMVSLLIGGITATTWQAIRATRAERRALTEAETTKAVNRFLTQDLLASASPEVSRKRDFTVREAVDRAAQVIGQRFGDRPLIESAVRSTLATTYDALGRADLGMPHAEAAYELRLKALGEDHPDTISSLNDWGAMYLSAGKFDDAEKHFRDAHTRARRVLGAENPLTLNAEGNLAASLRQQGRFDEAEPLYRHTLEASRRVLGPGLETARAANNFALFLHKLERFEEAEPLYREALEISARVLGRDHPDYLLNLSNLAVLLQNEGKHAEAETIFRQVLDGRRRLLGDDHPMTLQSINNLAVLLRIMNRPAEAEPLYREALQRRRSALGEEHPETLQSINNLAFFLFNQKQAPEAEALFREAAEKRRKTLGPHHPDTINSVSNLAQMLETQQRFADAEPVLAGLCEEETLKASPPKFAANLVVRYGICLSKIGKLSEAERVLLDAERRLRQTSQEHTARMNDALRALVDVYTKTKRPDEARAWQAKLDALRATTTRSTSGPSTRS
jgi:serine/threonine protein kinase/tetratricopeptide (TPR) repeat protein